MVKETMDYSIKEIEAAIGVLKEEKEYLSVLISEYEQNLVQLETLKARDLLELFDVFELITSSERIKIFKRLPKFISVSKRHIGKNKMVITTLMEIDLINWIAENKDKITYRKEDFKPCYAM